MNRASKNSKKLKKARIRSLISKAHVLIAVVAIIECLILISITTYSWIETASSLIIKTGHKNYEDTFDSRIPIANAFNYKFTINNTTPSNSDVADLNNYFDLSGESSTQNLFRFARASSANGKDFSFPKKNNLNSSTAYRKGDIIDSNSNYIHYDFTLNNKGAAKTSKYKFYFKEADVFNATNGSGSLTEAQLNEIKYAMRISFQTGNGTPKIYAMTSDSTDTVTSSAINYSTGSAQNVTVTKIKADENQKLFTIGKDSEQNISIRIWLEDKAITTLTAEQIAGVNIKVNLKLTYAQNDYDFLYFDDYTFSSGLNNKDNIGGHLTEDYNEANNYRMFFAYSTDGNSYKYFPMTIDSNNPDAASHSWVTCDNQGNVASTVPEITNYMYITALTTSGDNALTNSYFGYGIIDETTFNNSTHTSNAPSSTLYKWKLKNDEPADSSGELRYTGYSVTSTAAGSANAYGAGGWSYNTPLTMIYFRDRATGVTTNAYNNGDNYQYITNSVNVDSDTGNGNRSNVMYVNNGLANLSDSNKTNQAPLTATMYFDKSAEDGKGLFMSYIPESWTSAPLRFNYCPDGYYSNCCVSWDAATPSKPVGTNNYIFTALGCSQNYDVDYYSGSVHSGRNNWINPGVGTWREIESTPVYFSTELIDNYATSAHRYQIGVKLDGGNTFSYYHLIPVTDGANQLFYAYLPKAGTNTTPVNDYEAGAIKFREFPTAETHTVSCYWLGNARKGSHTFYPVKDLATHSDIASDTSSDYTRGYWNISVIVDGTYEHFFWDTRVESNPNDDGVLGSFQYNTTGHTGTPTYTDVTTYKLDEYRWYVPLDNLATIPEFIYYKWEPYSNTVFKYSQKLSDGIYCVITEAGDTTPTNAFN